MSENEKTARIYTIQLVEETEVKIAKVTADTVTHALDEDGCFRSAGSLLPYAGGPF